jgi:lipooligosaccharide transport system permease protein
MTERAGHSTRRQAARWVPVWRRNWRVWLKLAGPALVGNLGEPLLYLLAFGYGFGRLVGAVSGMPYAEFLASGIVCASAMNTATFEGLYSAYTRMAVQQTWRGMLVTPLSVGDILLGETVWAAQKAAVSAGAVLMVAAILGLLHGPLALWVLPIAFLAGACFGAIALVVTSLAHSYDFFLYYFTLVVTPMFLLSGVFFPLDQLPEPVQWAAQGLPLAHAVQLVRPLMVGMLPEGGWLHFAVLVSYALGAYRLAVILVRRRLLT